LGRHSRLAQRELYYVLCGASGRAALGCIAAIFDTTKYLNGPL
jgi:hypothetical protein